MTSLDDVRRMKAQVTKTAEDLGMVMDSFQVAFQDDGEYLVLNTRIFLKELLKDSDQETIDAAFDELVGGLSDVNPAISKQDFLQFLEED